MIFTIIYSCIIIVCAVAMAVLGKIVESGRGDDLIAGYNMASPGEKAQYDIKRLRRVISVLLYGMAVLLFLLCLVAFLDEQRAMTVLLIIMGLICIWAISIGVWGIKWAKKSQ